MPYQILLKLYGGILLAGIITLNLSAQHKLLENRQKCSFKGFSLQFEGWVHQKIRQSQQLKITTEVVTIPVVVHVIHQGEPIGQGTNISKAQILSQIRILNEDFRRKPGTTGFNNHPAGADIEIEFQLAVRTPDNLPTEGIVRVQGHKNVWSTLSGTDRLALKAQSVWNPAHYLNIWVADIEELGHGQFPVSDLPGIAGDQEALNALDDGIVVDYEAFGDIGTATNPTNGGRTATHEVGHYLGLLHIWGEGTCANDDFCADTPPVSGQTSGCPTVKPFACDGSPAQIENYMDYTDDHCMNMFTQQQKLRMRTVLAHSPRRKTLSQSPGLQPVILQANDARIEVISSVSENVCEPEVAPQVILRNMGTNVLTSLRIHYQVDNEPSQQILWQGHLPSLTTTTTSLPISSVSRGVHQLKVTLQAPNGMVDQDFIREKSTSFLVLPIASLPLTNDFEDASKLQDGWQIMNPDNRETWALIPLANQENNQALKITNFDYEEQQQEDFLITPLINSPTNQALQLQFKVAYAPFREENGTFAQDALKVGVSTDCGQTFHIVYKKQGKNLGTVTHTQADWQPTRQADWRTEYVDLSAWAGVNNLQVGFIGVNGFGNNLYLDDIKFSSETFSRNPNDFIRVSPNPTSATQLGFRLRLPQVVPQLYWALLDISGKKISNGQIKQAQFQTRLLNNKKLASGLYILKVDTPQFNITKRVIVFSK